MPDTCPGCGAELELRYVPYDGASPYVPHAPLAVPVPFVVGTDDIHDEIACLRNQLASARKDALDALEEAAEKFNKRGGLLASWEIATILRCMAKEASRA